MSSNDTTYDVIVIGVGSMGSAACYHLAKRGFRVLGLEQFDRVHEFGSHTGQSRIIRKAYYEHPDYVPLLQRSYALWEELERQTNIPLFFKTGILYFGDAGDAVVKGVKFAADSYGIPINLNPAEERKRFEEIATIPKKFDAVFEPDAGFALPEAAITLLSELASSFGAVIRYREAVMSWSRNVNGYEIKTDAQTYQCKKLVFSTGSWTSRLVNQYLPPLSVTEQLLTWHLPENPELFAINKMPCWFISDDQLGLIYGFPSFTDKDRRSTGVKIARHVPGEKTDPDKRSFNTNKQELDLIHGFVSAYFPKLSHAEVSTKNCLYTNSPDENFIIDFLPESNDEIVVVCGFSGHGFKFVPVVGEIIADMIEKKSAVVTADFLSLKRFSQEV